MAEPFTVEFPSPLPARQDGQYWWLQTGEQTLRLSNLDKVFWPDEGYTKGDLLAYYWNVAELLLPHLKDRPLTLKRMPDGIEGGHFYQKDAPGHTPEWIPRCPIEPADGDTDEMLMAMTPEHLLFVANLGAIEFHPLHSRCGSYDRPDYMVFDLDPFHPAGFAEALVVAHHVRIALETLGLQGLPKTSGATGIQIYVPVGRGHTYDDTRSLAERIGRMILRADPDLVTMEWSVPEREGRVFIDHNMNRRGASLASAYSVRPEAAAPVSTPLRWSEVEEGRVRPELFKIDTILARVGEAGELFAPVAEGGQDLAAAMRGLGLEPANRGPSDRTRPSLASERA